jgi:hypothetical protein
MEMPRRYRVLWIIALVLKVLAWVALAGSVLALLIGVPSLIAATARGAPWYEILPAGMMLGFPIFGIVWFVQLYAIGSILSLLIDIEDNTRTLSTRVAETPT